MLLRLLLALALACTALPAAAQTRWVMATPYAENFHTINIRQFIADIEKATNGGLVIQLHSNATLLPMGQIKRGAQTAQVQLGEILLSAYANEDPFFEVDGVPFLAWTWPQAEALNTATEPYIRTRLERQGLTLLYMVHWDAQGFYSRTPIQSLAELRGTRFRAYNNVTSRMAELMGATPVTVQLAEVSQAFATNVINTMFTSAQSGVSTTAWDFTRYWYNVGGMRTRNAVFANTRALMALDPTTRNAILAAATAAAERGKEMAKQAEITQSERLRSQGMQLPTPSDQMMGELRSIGETLTAEWAQRAGPEGVQMLERYRAALR
ncbi:TRAP transporter substrate-binding protein [Siccirubricoccus sp. KC 17139]|uniref:TRAP transporter substrate-binding protein n=1 Tax=Siccirubricoccus soli TaxID=2899147 RepID=A0ABT1D123_9PROT|nr:TRAP transporter substrate-binding protein [Siccirubricoccus soli]MCO6415613.1 TRAP transporter substrate-binding protein [Siccirubricoccus soli]MCP2681745.1 TRAP transporter substrate-binding protein [Siccirubricoccus soli]